MGGVGPKKQQVFLPEHSFTPKFSPPRAVQLFSVVQIAPAPSQAVLPFFAEDLMSRLELEKEFVKNISSVITDASVSVRRKKLLDKESNLLIIKPYNPC